MKNLIFLFLFYFLANTLLAQTENQIWPQFRGIDGMGVAPSSAKPPITFSEKNLHWKTELPKGVSSPVIWNHLIFITGFVDSTRELQTICLDRRMGKICWINSVVPDTVEKYHPIASPAQGSVATDGERVVACFGSYGLVCYDLDGTPMWKYRVAFNRLTYGHGTSPVIAGDKVIYFNDAGPKRFLIALDKKSGNQIWRTDLLPPKVGNTSVPSTGGHSVPCIYLDKIIINRVGGLSCYSLEEGTLLFDYKLMTACNATPFVDKNKVIVTFWNNFSEENQRGKLPGFDELLKSDKNQNGTLDKAEIPADMIFYQRPGLEIEGSDKTVRDFFGSFDTSKDKEITRKEWDDGIKLLNDIFYKPVGLTAISLEKKGELKDSSIIWKVLDNIPEVPSPLLYRNRIYMIKEGGILTCVDPENGKVVYVNRIGAPGALIASPIAADGYVYFFSYNGKMKVVKAGDIFEVAGEYDFRDKIAATPAFAGNEIYIRAGRFLLAYTGK